MEIEKVESKNHKIIKLKRKKLLHKQRADTASAQKIELQKLGKENSVIRYGASAAIILISIIAYKKKETLKNSQMQY